MIRRSILRGAAAGAVLAALAAGCGNDTAGDDDSTAAFVPDPPSVYVAKVKNLLVGLPPSDAEIAQVSADPSTLGALVDTWMALPQYQQKMMVFFELAFQQTQIDATDFNDMIPPNGLGNGKAVPQLVQNIRESFARTALTLGAEGKPLTDAFTTHRLMMTPALMELYAFLDTRQLDDAAKVTDKFAKANPGLKIVMEEKSEGPLTIQQSVTPGPEFMHWYAPGLTSVTYPEDGCTGLDPVTFNVNAQAVHALLYGEIPSHAGPSGNCPNRAAPATAEQVVAADFTTWKMVTIRPPAAGEATTVFYDLPAIRGAAELVVATPYAGFFTTPAFFANWPTNASNQMRVTANQALIVATGAAVDGTDTTSPPSTPGLDGEHAPADTACFGCHQQLDPTRSILSATYSWFYYPQTDAALMAQPGLFAFQHVVAPVATLDDFAHQLAAHPMVPQAWGQKLCYYVNSAPCNPIDPEFLRVIGQFTASGGAWNALVKAIVTSPITTSASQTATARTNGAVIAVSRRDHLCAALNNRLGFIDICQLDATVSARANSTIAQIVSGMPSDGYGRGATAPVLPNQPTLFYRSGLENVCAQVATMVIDAKPSASQPGAVQWSSAQPDAAISDFVALVMALTPSDPRAAQAGAILTSHFQAATATGAAAGDALRSTFVAACLSPSFLGIGM